MVIVTLILIYALCATVLLLAVAQARRRAAGRPAGRGGARDVRKRGNGTQHDLVFTTQH